MQAQLTHFITAGLEELCCFLSADVMDRLVALPTRLVAVGQANGMKRTGDERQKPIALGKLNFPRL